METRREKDKNKIYTTPEQEELLITKTIKFWNTNEFKNVQRKIKIKDVFQKIFKNHYIDANEKTACLWTKNCPGEFLFADDECSCNECGFKANNWIEFLKKLEQKPFMHVIKTTSKYFEELKPFLFYYGIKKTLNDFLIVFNNFLLDNSSTKNVYLDGDLIENESIKERDQLLVFLQEKNITQEIIRKMVIGYLPSTNFWNLFSKWNPPKKKEEEDEFKAEIRGYLKELGIYNENDRPDHLIAHLIFPLQEPQNQEVISFIAYPYEIGIQNRYNWLETNYPNVLIEHPAEFVCGKAKWFNSYEIDELYFGQIHNTENDLVLVSNIWTFFELLNTKKWQNIIMLSNLTQKYYNLFQKNNIKKIIFASDFHKDKIMDWGKQLYDNNFIVYNLNKKFDAFPIDFTKIENQDIEDEIEEDEYEIL